MFIIIILYLKSYGAFRNIILKIEKAVTEIYVIVIVIYYLFISFFLSVQFGFLMDLYGLYIIYIGRKL